MTPAVLDDHLLRDLLADELGDEVRLVLDRYEPATTNLDLHRLCRSITAAGGGALTGGWAPARRRALGAPLVGLSDAVEIVALRTLAVSMAEIAVAHSLSTLRAEAVAAAHHLDAPLCVWSGDDGSRISAAMDAVGATSWTVRR